MRSNRLHYDTPERYGRHIMNSGVDMVTVSTAADVDRAARQFPDFADGDSSVLEHRARVKERPFWNPEKASVNLNYGRRIQPSGGHAGKLIDYFQALNSGDQDRWERAFDNTWHPEGIVDGRSVAVLRDRHRRRLVAGRIKNIHVIRDIDACRVEFTTESGWKRDGPFVATFRDGRIYRLL